MMDLQERKYKFIQKLFKVEEDVFDKLEAQLDEFLSKRVDLKQYNKELEEANQRIDKGEFYDPEEVEKIVNSWE